MKKIFLTHNHFDHVDGVEEVVRETGAVVYIHPLDEEPVRRWIKNPPCPPLSKGEKGGFFTKVKGGLKGDFIKIGHLVVTALHTPGHTPGSTCYLVQEVRAPLGAPAHLFTGDTLFQGNCGRCDLPGGDPKEMFRSLQKLAQLDPATKVYPGHDYGLMPITTIGYEKEHNPTLKVGSLTDFDQIP